MAASSWKIQSTPNPASATTSVLSDVSCTAANACTAVGDHINAAGKELTLAERWNGTSWKIQSTPNPAGATESYLAGVSCTAANRCTAVGSYTNAAGKHVTLAERWNGTSWKIQSMPNPAGAKQTFVERVSCTAANACTAVGDYTNAAGTDLTLAERWNGTSWKIQSTPNPAGQGRLNGVSCTAAAACTAVGDHINAAGKG